MRRAWVRNGSLGVVWEVHEERLVVDFDRWGRVTVPTSYIEGEVSPGIRGGLQHAYALTTHAAEGSTYAIAVPLLTDASSRAGAYVGTTRGQFDLQAVLIRRRALVPPPTDDQLPVLNDETDALRATARRLELELPEQLASEVDPLAPTVHELAQRSRLPELAASGRAGADRRLYERALHERARIVGARAVVDPGPDVLEHLGARPSAGPQRALWDRAVAAIAVWREREQVLSQPSDPSPIWALGAWPARRASQGDYDAIAELVRTVERWPTDAWLWPEKAAPSDVPPLSAAEAARLESGAYRWSDLADEELRDVGRRIERASAQLEARLVNLHRVAALREQLGTTSEAEPEDQYVEPSDGTEQLRGSLDRYRRLAFEARAEVTRRALVGHTTDFLGVVGGQVAPESDPTSAVPDGPVIQL